MTTQATLATDLASLTANAGAVGGTPGGGGAVAVTNCGCGSPEVGRAPVAGAEVLGASRDHLICDGHEMAAPPRVGDVLRFRPDDAATVQLFTSPYAHQVFTPPA